MDRNLDCNSNFLTFQHTKSSLENWYPLNNLRIEFPFVLCLPRIHVNFQGLAPLPESSWEVSLQLPHTTFVFVLSLFNIFYGKNIVIIHLVRKTENFEVVNFYFVEDRTYSKFSKDID